MRCVRCKTQCTAAFYLVMPTVWSALDQQTCIIQDPCYSSHNRSVPIPDRSVAGLPPEVIARCQLKCSSDHDVFKILSCLICFKLSQACFTHVAMLFSEHILDQHTRKVALVVTIFHCPKRTSCHRVCMSIRSMKKPAIIHVLEFWSNGGSTPVMIAQVERRCIVAMSAVEVESSATCNATWSTLFLVYLW